MKKTILFSGLSATLILFIASCHKHDEGELITTVRISITPTSGGTTSTFIWKDPDGPGGNGPTQTDTIRLKDSTDYNAEISFLNESGGNSTDITPEIRNEGKEHLVCISGLPLSNLVINATDSDGKYPIGLQSSWKSIAQGSGLLRVNLRHQPKSKDGSCDAGESDVDVQFNLLIEP
jgi:hypothetical protein